ncbi:MAG: hypothetical protein KGJ05_06630 [Alphaproteobacteria bacterium]|nr:hypothetical protein [Alphaproteobacteria bacterium]MDE2340174.1 hypothetical protein [Alphaproteobacteria bacterium]
MIGGRSAEKARAFIIARQDQDVNIPFIPAILFTKRLASEEKLPRGA